MSIQGLFGFKTYFLVYQLFLEMGRLLNCEIMKPRDLEDSLVTDAHIGRGKGHPEGLLQNVCEWRMLYTNCCYFFVGVWNYFQKSPCE